MNKKLIVMAVSCAFAAPVFADEVSELRDRLQDQMRLMQQMQQQLDRLEKQQEAAPAAVAPAATAAPVQASALPANVITTGDLPKSIKINGTSLLIGGIAWGYGTYNSITTGPASGLDDALIPGLIPVGAARGGPTIETNKFTANAKPSRFFFRSQTPSDWGLVTTYIEADFLGSAAGNEIATNGYNPRLRHAYGTIGGLGIGQYWSTLINLSALPENLDVQPLVGWWGGGIRQAQIRWTSATTPGGAYWTIAAENPETYVATLPVQDNDKVPDLTAKYHFKLGSSDFEVSGAYRRLKAAAPNGRTNNGEGIGVGGSVPTFGKDLFLFSAGYGKGMGRYWGAVVQDAVIINNQLERIDTVGGWASYRHYWTPSLRSNVTFTRLQMSNPTGSPGTLEKVQAAAYANLFYTPFAGVDLGVEFDRGYRRIENGQSGWDNRFLVGGKYFF